MHGSYVSCYLQPATSWMGVLPCKTSLSLTLSIHFLRFGSPSSPLPFYSPLNLFHSSPPCSVLFFSYSTSLSIFPYLKPLHATFFLYLRNTNTFLQFVHWENITVQISPLEVSILTLTLINIHFVCHRSLWHKEVCH